MAEVGDSIFCCCVFCFAPHVCYSQEQKPTVLEANSIMKSVVGKESCFQNKTLQEGQRTEADLFYLCHDSAVF